MRAASRDNLRATVFRCITPFVVARCSSGWASCKADCAAFLSPVSIAVSTFLTKVRTRPAAARVIEALRVYEKCLSSGDRHNDCEAEMQAVDNAHDDFADAVADAKQCR